VLAYDAAGNASAQSAPRSVTTLGDTQAPTVPAGLNGTATSMTEINLTWTASTDNIGVTGYRVFRNGTEIANVTTGTTYADTGLTQNTSYTYTVLAYDADGNRSAQTAGGLGNDTCQEVFSLGLRRSGHCVAPKRDE
jgi:hypothetical protein